MTAATVDTSVSVAGLRRSIATAAVVLSITVAATAQWLIALLDSDAMTKAAAEVERLNLVVAEHVADALRGADAILVDVVADIGRRGAPDVEFLAAAGRDAPTLRARHVGHPHIARLRVVHPNLATSGSERLDPGIGTGARVDTENAPSGDDVPFLGRPRLDPGTREWRIDLSRGFRLADEAATGSVVAELDLARFEQTFRDLRLGESIAVALWSSDSTLLARHPADRITGHPDPAVAANHLRALSGAEAGTQRVAGQLNRTPLLLSVRRLPGFALHTTVSLPEASVLVRSESSRAFVLAAAIGLIGAILVVAVLAHRHWAEHFKLQREIMRRRRAEVLAVESEAKFRDGIESLGDGFLLWDRAERIVAWNTRLLTVIPDVADVIRVGTTRDAFIARANETTFATMSAEERTAWQARRRLNRDEGTTTVFTNRVGRVICVYDRRTSAGGIMSIYRDITDERRARQQLEESEAKARQLAQVAQHMLGAVVILDADRRITWCNSAFCNLTGYGEHEALGRTVRELIYGPQTSPAGAEQITEAIHSGRRTRLEMNYSRRDGTTFEVEVDVVPILDETGRRVGVIGVHVDVTERNEQARRLALALQREREVNAQQRRFISIVSHEFRTPLTIIDGAAQRLSRGAQVDGQEMAKRVDRIRRAVLRMTDIVERTLQSSQLDEGRIEIRKRHADLAAVAAEACDGMRAQHPDFEIVLRAPEQPIEIDGDPVLLEQVVANLVSNAVKYSGASRRVEVEITPHGAGLEMRVRDFGVGIPAAELPRLFGRFFRASTAGNIPGIGIGLHFVRELVRLHGGSIDVASEVGKGTTFVVRLPVASAEQDPAAVGG